MIMHYSYKQTHLLHKIIKKFMIGIKNILNDRSTVNFILFIIYHKQDKRLKFIDYIKK